MTREQAKREIDSLDYYLQNHTDDYSEESHTAMMMAISALSAKGDLISRQAVIDALTKTSGIRGDALKALYDLPSVENKGEWSRHTRVEPVYSIDGVKTWGDKCQCNRCTFTTIAVEGFGYYNFCPNCGAKMKGGE